MSLRVNVSWCMQDEVRLTQFNASQDLYRSGSLASDHSASVDSFEDDNRYSFFLLDYATELRICLISLWHKIVRDSTEN